MKNFSGLTITGATPDGYSVKANGYVKGSWLQSSVMQNYGSNTGKVCVFDNSGWIYYRTPAEILTEAGGVTQVKINGTTNSPDSTGLVDLGTISGGGGSSNVIVDSPMVNGVSYTVFGSGEYGSFIGTFATEADETGMTITVGSTSYVLTETRQAINYRLTIDKNDQFVYSTIVVDGGIADKISSFSTVPSDGIVRISTNLSSSYMESNRCVIIKE